MRGGGKAYQQITPLMVWTAVPNDICIKNKLEQKFGKEILQSKQKKFTLGWLNSNLINKELKNFFY